MSMEILEENGPLYYKPNRSSVSREVELTEKLNITIQRPEGIIHSFSNITLNSTVENAFTEIKADVNWTTNRSTERIGQREDSYWNTSGFEPGPINITAEAEKGNYTGDNETNRLDIYGYSNISFELDSAYSKGDIVDLNARVENTNTTSGIENYPVEIYKKKAGNQTELFKSGNTTTNGWFNSTWNTTGIDTSEYNLTASITDSSTLYYNATTKNKTENVLIRGFLDAEILNVTEDRIYRDEFSGQPKSTNITVNVTSENESVENATVEFSTGDGIIGVCETGYKQGNEGLCTFRWNPNSSATVGDKTVTVNANAGQFIPADPVSTNVVLRAGVRPNWDKRSESLTYNFTNSSGIPVNPEIIETFTNEGVPNYEYNVTWGEKESDKQINTSIDSWNNTTTRGEGIRLSDNTTAYVTNYTGADRVLLDIDSISGGYNISVVTESEVYNRNLNKSTEVSVRTDDETVKRIEIETNGILEIKDAEFRGLDIIDKRYLMNREVLGIQDKYQTDFESEDIIVANDQSTLDASNRLGIGVGTKGSNGENVRGFVRDDGVFGGRGLNINVIELEPNQSVTALKYYDNPVISNEQSFENAERISLWLNSNVSVKFQAEDENGCSYRENLSATENFELSKSLYLNTSKNVDPR
ncbi:hypothetical protein GLU64_00005 [Nanohaloarchaea archaeon]|nr:hypothetical protein [Candidatus Nanohaloarchaea archaeon]